MNTFISWVNSHKSTIMIVCAVIVVAAFLQMNTQRPLSTPMPAYDSMYVGQSIGGERAKSVSSIAPVPPIMEGRSVSNTLDRMIVTDTWMSLVTKNVEESLKNIENTSKDVQGFMVSTSITTPEGASSGNITIRVPSDKRGEVLEKIKTFGIRVVDEHVTGEDITDQYTDLEAQLDILQRTKVKFEAILTSATSVQDMLSVQRELTSLQSQIDSIKGQQMYLDKTAKYSKITVYLSTDDLALPYAPEQAWRPQATFKLAVRGLVGTLRGFADKAIWLGVYAPLWIPILLIAFLIYRKAKLGK